MDAVYQFLWLPFFIAGALMLAIGVYSWLRKDVPGAGTLAAICLFSAWWSACEGLLYFGFSRDSNILITQIQYLGMVWVAPLMLIFVFSLFAQGEWNRLRIYAAWLAIPTVVLILAWTNGYHGLIWSGFWDIQFNGLTMLGLKHGPAFWAYAAYTYFCLGLVTVFLVRWILYSASIFKAQALIILAAMGCTWLGNAVYLLGLSPIRNVDTTPLAFTLTAAIMAYGFFQHRLLDVAPVAKAAVFDSMLDGVIVLDGQDRVIDINPAGEKILEASRHEVVGRMSWEVFAAEPEIIEILCGRDLNREITLPCGGENLTYDLSLSTLRGRRNRTLGRLMVWRDISRRKELEIKLQLLATTDDLTGAANRRSFLEQGAIQVSRSRRYDHPLSVLALDLDKFKKVNDTFGHHIGDRVLAHFAALVRNNQREGDIFGRLGGEEFALLLPATGIQSAIFAAERLRRAAEHSLLDTEEGPVRVTVSIGVAGLKGWDQSLDDVLKRADLALYQAKDEGRNRVVSME